MVSDDPLVTYTGHRTMRQYAHIVDIASTMRQYESGPYIIVLFQPQCEHLSQAITGRVGVS